MDVRIRSHSRPLLSPIACPCGREFLPANTQAVYCPDCNTKAKVRERQRLRMRRAKAAKPPTPRMVPRQHQTIVLFNLVWPAVRAEAERSQSLPRALARLEIALRGIPGSDEAGADIIRYCVRERFATVDAALVGGSVHIGELQRRGRTAKKKRRCPYCTFPRRPKGKSQWAHTCGRPKCVRAGQRAGGFQSPRAFRTGPR